MAEQPIPHAPHALDFNTCRIPTKGADWIEVNPWELVNMCIEHANFLSPKGMEEVDDDLHVFYTEAVNRYDNYIYQRREVEGMTEYDLTEAQVLMAVFFRLAYGQMCSVQDIYELKRKYDDRSHERS
jgi:hypothetical protein